MKAVVLTGCDGANPLGFMVALGALRVLVEERGINSLLSWADEGRWRPVLHLPDDSSEPAEELVCSVEAWRDAPELALEYAKDGKGEKRVRDLKPPPPVFREFLIRAASSAWRGNRRLADFAVAYASDVARDGKGNTKPTALHFTAGQQNFVEMVAQLTDSIVAEHIVEALYGPWRYDGELPVLRWDVSGERLYALLASDPSSDKARGVPGADWLAFQALPLFPCFPKSTLGGASIIQTTGFSGRGKDSAFRWPIWTPPASLEAVRSLLQQPIGGLRADQRRARGVEMVLESHVRRSDHGYGAFGAAVPAPSAG